MEFNFTPVTDDLWFDEKNKMPLATLKEGFAKFTVKSVEDAVSSSGNPQMVLTLDLEQDGIIVERRDYIVLIDSCRWRIITLCKATGKESLKDKVSEGSLTSNDLVGTYGQCLLKNETYNGKERLKIKAYIAASTSESESAVPAHVQVGEDLKDDEIPF